MQPPPVLARQTMRHPQLGCLERRTLPSPSKGQLFSLKHTGKKGTTVSQLLQHNIPNLPWNVHANFTTGRAKFSKRRGKSWGRLYFDLSAAFDSILREFLIADSTCNVQLMQSALKALNISDEVCDQIVFEAITERNLIRRTGASAQLGDLVGDMHTATWIVCSKEMPDNDDMVVWTKRGSRQGCPLGGIALLLMYEQVLRKITNSWRKARNLERDHVPPGTATLERVF